MVKHKKVNLNNLIEDQSRNRQTSIECSGRVRVHFSGERIVAAIVRRMKRSDCHYVVGCSAWFTNEKIIRAMSELKGVAMIVTLDKTAVAESNKRKYRTLPLLNDAKSAIQTIGTRGSKWTKSLMHHKFLVFLNEKQEAVAVSNGSFNLTNSATRHLENVVFHEDPGVATCFKEEFLRLFAISKPLKL